MFPTSKVNIGCKPLVKGVPALLSFMISNSCALFFTSQTQPEPNKLAAAALNSFLKLSKLHCFSMAEVNLAEEVPFLRNKLEEIKRMIPDLCGIIENTLRCFDDLFQTLFSKEVSLIKLFKLFTYA